MNIRPIFKDSIHQQQFNQEGYTIIDLFDDKILNEIEKEYNNLTPSDQFLPNNNEYHCTFIDKDINYKKNAFKIFNKFFSPIICEFLYNYQLVIGNFYIKPKGSREFEIHQNWSIVDESKFTSLTLWIPLQDTNSENGTLEVIPKSNKLSSNITCYGEPYFFHEFEYALKENYFKSLNLKRGQIVIFDDNLIHYSKENKSEQTRRAIQLVATPKEAQLQIFLPDIKNNDVLNVYEASIDYFLNNDLSDYFHYQPQLAKIGSIIRNNKNWTLEEFKEAIENKCLF
jgi:hypothetical protein